MGGGGGSPTASSSGDDDGDASWKAAIESVAAVGFGFPSSNGVAKATAGSGGGEADHGLEVPPQEGKAQAPGLKLYQIKETHFFSASKTASSRSSTSDPEAELLEEAVLEAEKKWASGRSRFRSRKEARNMLDDMLDKNLEIVRAPCLNLVDPIETDGRIKLFKKAPPGISMDDMDKHYVQLKRPKILPGPMIDEKSKKFRHMLQAVVVDGNDVLVSAKQASQISLARLEARETAAKDKAKREEERVKEFKKVRGEKWLPSIARQIKKEKAWVQRQ